MATTSALATVTDYVNDARVLLQDRISPYRYDDDSLVTALNLTLAEGRRLRADLFLCGVPFFSKNDGTDVPIEIPFRLAFLHGLVGYALERDQEDTQDARAGAFLKIFNDILLGVRPTNIAIAAGGRR